MSEPASPSPRRGREVIVRRGPATSREIRCGSEACASARAAGEAAGNAAARTGIAVVVAARTGAVRCPDCGSTLRGR